MIKWDVAGDIGVGPVYLLEKDDFGMLYRKTRDKIIEELKEKGYITDKEKKDGEGE